MFVVLTYTSNFIVYFVRALRDALKKNPETLEDIRFKTVLQQKTTTQK